MRESMRVLGAYAIAEVNAPDNESVVTGLSTNPVLVNLAVN